MRLAVQERPHVHVALAVRAARHMAAEQVQRDESARRFSAQQRLEGALHVERIRLTLITTDRWWRREVTSVSGNVSVRGGVTYTAGDRQMLAKDRKESDGHEQRVAPRAGLGPVGPLGTS